MLIQKISSVLLFIFQFFLIADLLGQPQKIDNAVDEPLFIIRVEQNGQSEDVHILPF